MIRGIFSVALLGLLSGCATQAILPQVPEATGDLRGFVLRGRVAVQTEGRGYSAGLRWSREGGIDHLRLLSPLGTTLAELEVGDSGAVLRHSDGETVTSSNVEVLAGEALGWEVPLRGLRHWILGRRNDSLPVAEEVRDERGRLVLLRQEGWQIRFPAYAANSALPSRLRLVRERLEVKIVIDRWERVH